MCSTTATIVPTNSSLPNSPRLKKFQLKRRKTKLRKSRNLLRWTFRKRLLSPLRVRDSSRMCLLDFHPMETWWTKRTHLPKGKWLRRSSETWACRHQKILQAKKLLPNPDRNLHEFKLRVQKRLLLRTTLRPASLEACTKTLSYWSKSWLKPSIITLSEQSRRRRTLRVTTYRKYLSMKWLRRHLFLSSPGTRSSPKVRNRERWTITAHSKLSNRRSQASWNSQLPSHPATTPTQCRSEGMHSKTVLRRKQARSEHPN